MTKANQSNAGTTHDGNKAAASPTSSLASSSSTSSSRTPTKNNRSNRHHNNHHQISNHRDAHIRTCIFLTILLGIPFLMVWWQVSQMPLSFQQEQPERQQPKHGNGIRDHDHPPLAALDATDLTTIAEEEEEDQDEPEEESKHFELLSDAVQTNSATKATKTPKGKKSTAANKKDDENTTSVAPTTSTTSTTTKGSSSSSGIQRPSMVWLMSYPNSGTSYTMRMVASASNRATATNYGPEVTDPSNRRESVSLYPLPPPSFNEKDGNDDGAQARVDHHEGPFWNPQGIKPALPDHYILTKTHCGGRCVRCPPKTYILTLPQFIHACTEGMGCFFMEETTATSATTTVANITTPVSKREEKQPSCQWTETHYPPPPNNPRIAKMIHLIRDPFDNIVSRYHLARKLWETRLEKKPKALQQWMEDHPNNATGFENWCNEMDTEYGSPFDVIINSDQKNKKKHPDASSMTPPSKTLPCQGEWFRYIQWHTLALATIEQSELVSLTVHYEEYEPPHWNATVDRILDFLEVPRPLEVSAAADILEFADRPPYDEYYTPDQRVEARSLVQQMTSPAVWALLERYFAGEEAP